MFNDSMLVRVDWQSTPPFDPLAHTLIANISITSLGMVGVVGMVMVAWGVGR